MKDFFEWILNIGDGKLGKANNGKFDMKIPNDLLIKDYDNPIEAIVQSTYPSHIQDVDIKETLHSSTILAPKLSIVSEVNSYMYTLNDREEK